MVTADIMTHEQFLRDRERRNAEVVASLKAGQKPRRFIPRHLRRNVYLTTDDHDRIIANHRSLSWKEASLAEKVRDGLVPPEVLDYFELTGEMPPPSAPNRR